MTSKTLGKRHDHSHRRRRIGGLTLALSLHQAGIIFETVAELKPLGMARRRPATSELVRLNRRNGPEQVMQRVEERAPAGFNDITDVISPQELEDVANTYKRVAGFQVEALNARPPIVLPSGRVF